MKTQIAYAIVNKRDNLITFNSQLPIYWIRKVAVENAEKYGGEVVEVIVSKVVANLKTK